jgi:hypothetical protein
VGQHCADAAFSQASLENLVDITIDAASPVTGHWCEELKKDITGNGCHGLSDLNTKMLSDSSKPTTCFDENLTFASRESSDKGLHKRTIFKPASSVSEISRSQKRLPQHKEVLVQQKGA